MLVALRSQMVIRMLVTLLFVECGSFHGDLTSGDLKKMENLFRSNLL